MTLSPLYVTQTPLSNTKLLNRIYLIKQKNDLTKPFLIILLFFSSTDYPHLPKISIETAIKETIKVNGNPGQKESLF